MFSSMTCAWGVDLSNSCELTCRPLCLYARRAANVFCNDLRYSPPTECTDTNDVFDEPAAALATQLCEPDSESWSARNTGVVFLT